MLNHHLIYPLFQTNCTSGQVAFCILRLILELTTYDVNT